MLIKTLDLLKRDINIRNIKYDRYCLHELYLYEDMLPKTLRLEKPHSLRDYIKEAMRAITLSEYSNFVIKSVLIF